MWHTSVDNSNVSTVTPAKSFVALEGFRSITWAKAVTKRLANKGVSSVLLNLLASTDSDVI
jgi:hypothetical protein